MPFYLIIVLIVIVIIAIYSILTYNSLIKLQIVVKEAFATMDVYLKQRWDLIPNLVETVKGYAKHEKDTFEKIVNLRNNPYEKMGMDEKIDVNNNISHIIPTLFAVAESYPELKSNQNFLGLQESISKIENDIAQSRKYYNATVRDYNIKVTTIPSSIISKLFKFNKLSMFEIDDNQKENVNIKF